MKELKKILLLKLPYCTHPDSASIDTDFRTRSTFRPVPSLALATLCGFIDKYKALDYEIKAIDINIEAYQDPGEPIDKSVYPFLLSNTIKNNNYDILCLSVTFVFNIKWVEYAIKLSKKFHPNAKIILGGGYPTLFPKRCLEKYNIDYVIVGEGESTFLHILNRINNQKDIEFEKKFPFSGYGTKNEKGEIIIKGRQQNEYIDLADLPLPAWNYLNLEKYFKKSGDNYLPIEATRGCPFRCSFCSTYLSWGLNVRYKPIENVINEIIELKKRYNVAGLSFVDDNLTFSKEWIVNFLKKIIAMKLPIKLTASNFSVKCLDEKIIDLLVKASFYNFGIAVETGCPEMQKKINKNLDFNHIRKIVKKIKSYKEVHLHINWMVGFPNESLKQIKKTFNFARELQAHSNQFLVVLPYPKTQLFEEARQEGLLIFDDKDLDKFDNRKCDYLKSREWNHDILQDMIYDANIELNFFKNPFLESEQGRKRLRIYMEEIIKKLPEHIIANIMVGYLYKISGNDIFKKYYDTAIEFFKDKELCKTFNKYLSWKNPIIDDFKRYSTENEKKYQKAKSFSKIKIGDKAEFEILVDEKMHNSFAALSSDYSPIHINKEFCSKTKFKKKIGYAFLLTSFLSKLYGEYLPGGNSICIKQEAKFINPFFINDRIRIIGEVVNKIDSTKFLEIKTEMFCNNKKKAIFKGTGTVQVLFDNLSQPKPIYEYENKPIYYSDLVDSVKQAGIKNGDIVFVHSNISVFGKLALPDRDLFLRNITNVLKAVVGENGAIIMPTFTYSFCKNQIYDSQNSKSTVGVLSEYFRKQPDVKRTLHPIFSVAVWAKHQNELLKIDKDSFNNNSIFGKLRKLKGKILFLGAPFQSCTFLHHIEQNYGVPYRYMKIFKGKIRITDQEQEYEDECTFFVHHLDKNVILNTSKLEKHLLEKGLMQEVKLGNGRILTIESTVLFNEGFKLLDKDIYFFLKEKPDLNGLRKK